MSYVFDGITKTTVLRTFFYPISTLQKVKFLKKNQKRSQKNVKIVLKTQIFTIIIDSVPTQFGTCGLID